MSNNTLFEAFGPTGNSLGVFGPFSLGDSSISRTTDEDLFLGVINLAGISAIKISMPGTNNWEVDHLQYGSIYAVPEPTMTSLVIVVAGCCLASQHRRFKKKRLSEQLLPPA